MKTKHKTLISGCAALILAAFVWTNTAFAGDPEGKPAWTIKAKNKLENFMEVVGNTLIYTRDGDYITVIDPKAGAVKWEKKIEGFKDKAFRMIWNDNMYIYGTKKEMVALNLADGTEKYRLALNKDVDPTDYVDYITTSNGVLINYKDNVGFYDLTEGKELWLRKDKGMSAASYLVFKNGNFLAFYSKTVSMIDYKTGTDVWSRQDKGFMPSDYKQLGNGNFLVFYDKDVRLIDFATGKDIFSAGEESNKDLKYQYVWEPGNPDTPILLFLKNKTTLISGKDGKVLWTIAAKGNKDRGGVKEDKKCSEFAGNALLVYLDKTVACINWTTGEEKWKETVKDNDDIKDINLYLMNDENKKPVSGMISLRGGLLKFSATDGSKLWQTPDESFYGDILFIDPIENNDVLITSYKLKLFSKTSGMHFYRMDMNAGKIAWHTHEPYLTLGAILGKTVEQVYGSNFFGPFVYKDLNAFMLMTNQQGVQWYSLADGKEQWRLKENMVYGMTYNSKPLEGVDIVSQWKFAMGEAVKALNHLPLFENGIMYLAGDEKIWAMDIKTGKKVWDVKINGDVAQLSQDQKNMMIKDGVLYCKTGFYLDENILNGTRVEKPVVFYNKGDFGFIAVDIKTGKVIWKYQDYEGSDPEYLFGMKISKDELEKGKNSECKLKNLKVGTIFNIKERENYRMFLGQDGIAGVVFGADNPCKSSWRIKGNIKNMMDIQELKTGKSFGVFFLDSSKRFLVNMDKDLYYFDEAGQKVLWKAGIGGMTKLSLASGYVFDVDGKELKAYKLAE